ncbi:Tat pathway signal sequence [Coniochaeta hoffmannii]|uniref:Tat pathway signal sequence n=1 Tax=Coniochaeta hoffmannii TaxID=91930 RepID=A0AA38RW56_9PEZI|nr:Tat pathway signal sequence [Coniochaeta hoffmannii]
MWWGRGDDWRRTWGYDFKWTPDHRTKDELAHLMYSYDELATECLDILDEVSPPAQPQGKEKTPRSDTPSSSSGSRPSDSSIPSGIPPSSRAPPVTEKSSSETTSPATPTSPPKNPKASPFHRDYFTLLQTRHATHPTLNRLWTDLNTLPPWVDPAQLARGQEVFYRYAGPAIVGLTFQSLLGGMGGYRVVETLSRTGGFGVRVARRRLLETFQHILLVTRDIDSLLPGGEGWASSVRVRFLHASVRRRILQLATREGNGGRYYDVDRHGVPINDLDSIGTIAAFSATLIWVSFPRQGIYLTSPEKEDYVALWRYVGYLLGTPVDPYFASTTQAKAVMESLMMTEIDPTPTSRVLANNIIAALANAPPSLASEEFLRAETRWLNGWELSDALDVPRPGVWYTVMVGAQCVFFMVVCYASRMVPAWDRRRIEGLKIGLRRIVVGLAGGEAGHEFKYVPGLDVHTSTEEGGGEKGVVMLGRQGLGRRNVKMLAVTGTVVAGIAWLGLRYAAGMWQRV